MEEDYTFFNHLSVASFLLGLLNYEENLTQSDKSEILQNSQNVSDKVIEKIERHLENQDKKIDTILQLLSDTQCRQSADA